MIAGKASVVNIGANECLAVINTDAGDHYELKALTQNHARRRVEDFCRVNQIVLTESPAAWVRLRLAV